MCSSDIRGAESQKPSIQFVPTAMQPIVFSLLISIGFSPMVVANDTVSAATESEPTRHTLFFNEPPSVDELAAHLFPPRTRGLVIGVKPESAAEPTARPASKKSLNTAGMPVLFHFGKTTLVESSMPYLDQVGKLMQRAENSRETLIIEGHTDAVGSDEYNERLSELRALAVKQYLVEQYRIDPIRLFPQGRGESLLRDQKNPQASVNRRVEFLRYQPKQ